MVKNVLIVTGANFGRGGVQAFLLKWFSHAKTDEYKFTWYFPGKYLEEDIDYLKDFEPLGIRMVAGNVLSMPLQRRMAEFSKDVNSLLKEEQFDIIHINTGAVKYQYFALKAAVDNNVECRVVHSHNNAYTADNGDTELELMRAYLRDNATKCTACSKDAGVSLFGKQVLNSDKWSLTINTINVSKFTYDKCVREQYRKNLCVSSDIIIGCVGRFNHQKNQQFLIDVQVKLEQMGLSAKLLLIGDGKLREEIVSKTRELRYPDNVVFVGTTPNVNEYLQAVDIFAMPSRYEGFSIAALEAQTAGCYCLLSDRFTEEIVITDRVELLPIDDAQKWADRIIEISQSSILMNDNAREMANKIVKQAGFDEDIVDEQIEKLYYC